MAEKVLETVRRKKEAARPEEEKQEKAWQTLKRAIKSSADTIHGIDTGQCRGYSLALFVSSILNKVSTMANHGEVEIVRRAVDFISEYNARVKKPVTLPPCPCEGGSGLHLHSTKGSPGRRGLTRTTLLLSGSLTPGRACRPQPAVSLNPTGMRLEWVWPPPSLEAGVL